MGEAKRRAICFAGSVGAFADDADINAASEALVEELLPKFAALAEKIGWATVLNALHTIVINVGVRTQGAEQVKGAHLAALAALPRLIALAASENSQGGRA